MVSLWVFFRLPECKGRSFRELGELAPWIRRYQARADRLVTDILFERGVSARKFASTKIEAYEES